MFARTRRLLLRPGFPEDAPQLAQAIAEHEIVRNLARAPWPYGIEDAKSFLASMNEGPLPTFLIFERTAGAPELVGACGFDFKDGGIDYGYWIARKRWGRGIATEAGRAALEIARTIGLKSLQAAHFLDNPASGRVLEKLGFTPTGRTAMHYSCGRGREAATRLYRLDLSGGVELTGAMAA
ncbi:GNAT family N-acetyltransferase [Sphingomicrobium nitratireducens]|uniref:GNAT family N-acetyltransferase n=1 Tax=Sphingomicrobium nitratireducens TaxID=2964666 RepID=UPI00223EFF7B|nr:GNAT family N-acetyltransferase [Sphingomicrobium nitratireducens]